MPMQLEDLDLLEPANGAEHFTAMPSTSAASATGAGAGTPLQIPIHAIDEDPEQPRKEFDPVALQELADSIAERGVLQAISVRPHPTQPQRWMVNFGARRLRASKLVGKPDIPAFVDPAADNYDQVIENEQREGLKPLELALFVQRRMDSGDSQAEIARRIGKSRQYITYATALIEASDWLLSLYRQGRCRGLRELYELRKLHRDHPRQVEAWAAERDPITREGIEDLRAAVTLRPPVEPVPVGADVDVAVDTDTDTDTDTDEGPAPRAAVVTAGVGEAPAANLQGPRPSLRLRADLDGSEVSIVVGRAPAQSGHVYVYGADGSHPSTVAASRLRLLGFVFA